MRLTLRTMLAYLDDILDPHDAQTVGKKIDESEFATSLVHRMRDVTRRLRLGAPKLYGKGMGLDPNTVAEYLDNTLLSERVADFEKVCLESDVHLAEVASCHQILALVLGEPAEVESTSRQRLYEVIHQVDATAKSRTPKKADRKSRDDADRATRRKKKRRRPKVPEYLREQTESEPASRPWAAVLLVVVLLSAAAIGIGMFWPDISRRFQVAQNPSEAADDTASGHGQAENGATQVDGGNRQARQSVVDTPTNRSSPIQIETGEGPASSAEEAAMGVDSAPPPEPDEDSSTSAAADGQPSRGSRQSADTDENLASTDSSQDADEVVAKRPAGKTKNSASEGGREQPSSAEGVGRLISEHDVLLRSVEDEWQRVPPRGTVYSAEQLIALPTYRPSVAMSNGVTLQLVGGSVAAIGKTDDEGVSDVTLRTGRLLLLTVAKTGAKIRLRAGDFAGVVEFGKDEPVLAVEVAQRLPDGADPEQEAAPSSVDLYLTSGEVTWTDQRGRSETLRGRVRRSLDNPKRGQQAADELPAWIEESELNPTERRAMAEMEPFLRADKPVAETLTELATHRKIELSLLATLSLALIEEFDPIVPLLNDSRYRTVWSGQIDTLRAAIARGPRTASSVREAFEHFRNVEEGDQLYRMLWGYTTEQLEDGAAAQLIQWLDAPDEKLDFRVLSYWNLHHITGLGLYYQPADPEKQRRTPIQRWKQKFESGQIVPKAT